MKSRDRQVHGNAAVVVAEDPKAGDRQPVEVFTRIGIASQEIRPEVFPLAGAQRLAVRRRDLATRLAEIPKDALGREGERVAKNADLEVWAKQLKDGSRAVVLLNRGGTEQEITTNWEDLGYPASLSASVRDLWQHKDLGKFSGTFSARVASHGVVMVTVRP